MRRLAIAALWTSGVIGANVAVLATYSAVHGSQGHTEASHGTLAARPACPGTVVTVSAHETVPCDVQHGQRLDITGLTIDQCDQMGGEPISLTETSPIVCEGVDY
jgi:hypothetical protein